MALFGKETEGERRRATAYREWFVRQHPLAVASIILSVFSLTHFGTLWIDEIAGIVLGVIAIRQNRAGASPALAYGGIIVGIISLICAIVIYTYHPR